MASRDDAAKVAVTRTELKSSIIDGSVEDVHKEFTMFRTLPKMWLETNGISDHKQCMFILQLLGKEALCNLESFPLSHPNKNEKEQSNHIWEGLEGLFRQITSEGTGGRCPPSIAAGNESITDLCTRWTVLLDKCNDNPCFMKMHMVNLFICDDKYFAMRSWPGNSQLI